MSVAQSKEAADFLSQRVRQIPASGIRRFFDLLASMDGVISLGVGEPDFPTPWHIREAAIYSLEKGYTTYTSNYGLLELRRALATHLEGRYGVCYDPDTQLLITVGVSEALDLALRAILNPGDEVLSPDPSYVSYMPGTVLAGGKFIPVPTRMETGFRVQPSDLEAKIAPRAKAILLGYPSNPTGAVMEREELLQIAQIARRHDLLVISDEIYDRLVYGVEHTCFASLPQMPERTILLGGFSKAYAMTGWRVGYAAAPAPIIEAMMKIHQYAALCAPIMSQKAALEALRAGEAAVLEMVADYDRRRRVMVKGLNDIGLSCFEPQGAFYAFPSIGVTGLSSEEFAERLLVEEKVAVVPGSAFGAGGEGHVRCCYATSLAEINEALRRMARFVEHHR
ncbi:MAG: aminotransferase class I/II-fold pyridoxal phosphate-dependent enzyme [Chloroflexi bacterium]|nr:aminotransferase class I/II-fold pyridoxal phosphate-dependent enzyme [Chloroflexota bacterium]